LVTGNHKLKVELGQGYVPDTVRSEVY